MADNWKKRVAEYEKKKARERENRLKKLQALLTENIKEIAPQDTERYEIVYKPMKRYYNSTIGTAVSVSTSDSPAYSFLLVSRSNPNEAYLIMHIFKGDIDKKVRIKDMGTEYQIPAFRENIREGIEYLQTGIKKRRDKFRIIRDALEKKKPLKTS